jgi:DNA modification methylase
VKPYYERDGITIYHGDCREILPHVDADVIVTDPPYGIGEKWTRREMVGRNGSSRLWGKAESWDDAPPDAKTFALMLSRAPLACVWGGNYFGLPAARQWLVWDKVQKFTGSDAELAWTNWSGTVRVYRLSRVEAYANAESIKQHPTEKPLGLMRWCIGLAPPGVVLDPFMGSGTTLVAARDMGRRAIGIEIEERYCEIAAKRLAQGVLFGLKDDA